MAKPKVTDEEKIKALVEGASPTTLDISLAKIVEWKNAGKITDEQIKKLNLNDDERALLNKELAGSGTDESYVQNNATTVDQDFVLPEDYEADPTLFAGFENFSPELQKKLLGNIGAGKRYKLDGSVDRVLGPNGQLVDAGLYDINAEAKELFWSLKSDKRKEILTTLQKHGLYFGSKPSPGFNMPEVDLEPFKRLMLVGNSLGGDIDVALEWVKMTPPTGSGPAPSYSAREDRRETLRSTLQEKTGMVGERGGFIERSSEQIAQQERARGGSRGGEQASSLGSAAGGMVEGEFADETKAYNFAKYARILNQMAGR
jgi:hypothetical protein